MTSPHLPPPEPASDDGPDTDVAAAAPTRAEPAGTDAFLQAVLALLATRPMSPFELERAIERTWPRYLRGRRGYVHPALLILRQRGAISASWQRTPRGMRRTYCLRHADGVADVEVPDEDAPPDLVRAAERIAGGLAFAPPLQEHVRQDVLQHLVDAAAARRDAGEKPGEARCEVLRDFGDAWRIRTDLRRITQGRRTVLMPRNLVETLQGLAIYDAGILLCIVGVIVFLRLQVFSAYHIPTRSMEPTLHGDRRDGDRILVNRLAGTPDRFDIWVFEGWGAERKNYVKRCVGLPGETLRLREGDVYVDDELVRKTGDAYEALLFPLYAWDDIWARAQEDNPDDPKAAHEQVFEEQFDLWENASGKWIFDTSRGYHTAAPAEGERATLRWNDTVHDDLYDPATGDVEGGTYTCPDLRVTASIVLEDAGSELTVHLTRGATAYHAVVRAGTVELQVEGEPVASVDDADVTPGTPVRVQLSQVDRVLRLRVDDVYLEHELPQPEFPKRSAPHSEVDFRVRGGGAWVKPLALERDVFYTPDYDDDFTLGPNEYFMLGDNSGNSQDSRRNGPVHGNRLVGRPVLIVWPPKRWRIPR